MARIFTTSFQFNHRQYDAIVTLISQDSQINFHVKILDADIHHLIPNGEVQYTGIDGFEKLDIINNTLALSMMRRLQQVIHERLVVTPQSP